MNRRPIRIIEGAIILLILAFIAILVYDDYLINRQIYGVRPIWVIIGIKVI